MSAFYKICDSIIEIPKKYKHKGNEFKIVVDAQLVSKNFLVIGGKGKIRISPDKIVLDKTLGYAELIFDISKLSRNESFGLSYLFDNGSYSVLKYIKK